MPRFGLRPARFQTVLLRNELNVTKTGLAPYSSYVVGAKLPRGTDPVTSLWNTAEPLFLALIAGFFAIVHSPPRSLCAGHEIRSELKREGCRRTRTPDSRRSRAVSLNRSGYLTARLAFVTRLGRCDSRRSEHVQLLVVAGSDSRVAVPSTALFVVLICNVHCPAAHAFNRSAYRSDTINSLHKLKSFDQWKQQTTRLIDVRGVDKCAQKIVLK